jgi:hypothetical protein
VKDSKEARARESKGSLGRKIGNRGPSGNSSLSRELTELLQGLADLLIHVGITPRHFGELAAAAFVRAACKASRLRNGRVNQSRVAVLTGLSRSEVRKIMADARSPKSRHQPRTQRVIDGWRSNRTYQDRLERPRSLRINGRGNTFESLVKKCAGDVPYVAVLDELLRLRAVRIGAGRVRLLNSMSHGCGSLVKSLRTVLPVLRDGMSAVSAHTEPNSLPPVFRLTLKATDSREVAVVRERAVAGATAFLHGLDRSLRNPSGATNARTRDGRRVTISVLVSEQETTKGTGCGNRSKEA